MKKIKSLLNKWSDNTLYKTNKKEFIALIEEYESITLEQIETLNKEYNFLVIRMIANILTGFGISSMCTLCLSCKDCSECYHVRCTGTRCTYDKTYTNIWNAETCEDLLQAFKARAKYMRTLLLRESKRVTRTTSASTQNPFPKIPKNKNAYI